MNLKKKKALAVKVLKVGRARILFVKPRLGEIKEAITKQDIRDLYNEGAIIIKPIKGRSKIKKRKKRSAGKIKKKVNTRKRDYSRLARKFRKYTVELRSKEELTKEQAEDIRKKIKDKHFKSLAYLKDYIKEIKK